MDATRPMNNQAPIHRARQELTDVLSGAADSGAPAVIVDLGAVTLPAGATPAGQA